MTGVSEETRKQCRICSGTDLRAVSGPWGRHLVCRQCGSVTKDLTFDEYQAMNPSYDPVPNIELESQEAVLEYLFARRSGDRHGCGHACLCAPVTRKGRETRNAPRPSISLVGVA